MIETDQNPPQHGEGDHLQGGGGAALLKSQPSDQIKRARKLRKTMSLPEVLLWQELRKRPGGFKFRRQMPLHPYTLDFACIQSRVAIEVDGEAHDFGTRPERDVARDVFVQNDGFATLRIPAKEVLNDMENCLNGIVAFCAGRAFHSPSPPPPSLCDGPPPHSGEDLL